MEALISYELFEAAYIPTMSAMVLLAGYLATDRLYLQDTILFLNGNKAMAVALISIPIAAMYVTLGHNLESVFFTYLSTNGLYDLLIKKLKP